MEKWKIIVSTFISCVAASTSYASVFTYNIYGSNNGDAGGPPVRQNVAVFLAANNSNCNPYQENCTVDCNKNPNQCSQIGVMLDGMINTRFSPQYENSDPDGKVSVWIWMANDMPGGKYYQCTPCGSPTGTINISAHLGGCLGTS